MLRDTKPSYKKGQIDRAGDNIRKKIATEQDVEIIENWRASHNHILNSWQATLRNRIIKSQHDIVFAQRLKRRKTIYDKLMREPKMNLSRMEDVAGCRLIFNNMDELHIFRNEVHSSRILHKRRYSDQEPYPRDYICQPKQSGYRGIHDIYSTQARKGRPSEWDGLHVEIQYRTIYQHAWATAVETAGYITGNHVKFDRGSEKHKRFFQLASEILARAYELEFSCLKYLKNTELVYEFNKLDSEIGLVDILHDVHEVARTSKNKSENIILILDPFRQEPTQVKTFESTPKAILAYESLEKKFYNLDIVLVRAKDFSTIQKAYKNYFWDTTDFVGYIEDGIKKLQL